MKIWIQKLIMKLNTRLHRTMLGHRTRELEQVEALKSHLPFPPCSTDPAILAYPSLRGGRTWRRRRWRKEAARFIEISRDPAVVNIELYQRFKPVADRINALAGENLSVLDVGGRDWTFSAFLPRHHLLIADLETTGIDARDLPYQNAAFDVVTSHHLLEHVPAPDRKRVMAELVRVARRRVFVTGPFEENPFAREIDELLVRLAPDNVYLQEHARLGLPSLKEIEVWLSAEGLRYRVEPLTRCNVWLLALALTRIKDSMPRQFRELTRYYNHRFLEYDRREPAYQSLIEIDLDR
ncbi:MAG: class I SAM-dependent methyltransferase [Candidatus Methylomirabilis oxyfera]|nr:class I SAM-dependent methyltransferase [Candidatus Methylomirabilis oxyfera]